jgi:organic radical activating enzyme
MKTKKKLSDGQGPFGYQKLIFFLNRRCDVGCASCNAAASPGNRRELSPEWLFDFFKKISTPRFSAGSLAPGNGSAAHGLRFSGFVLWTGGEPFLSFEALKTGIDLTSRFGYRSEILTSASWFANHPGYLKQLLAAGHFTLRISLDAEHREKVPLSLVFALIEQAINLGIETNFTVRRLPGQQEAADDYIGAIKKTLPRFYRQNVDRSRWIHIIPHIAVAPADTRTAASPIPVHRKWQNSCRQGFIDLVVGEDGFIYPCCGLFSLPCYPRLRAGNPLSEDWQTIEARRIGNPLFRALKTQGPYHICRELGLQPETWSWPSYRTPCHLCLALFHFHADRVLSYYSG